MLQIFESKKTPTFWKTGLIHVVIQLKSKPLKLQQSVKEKKLLSVTMKVLSRVILNRITFKKTQNHYTGKNKQMLRGEEYVLIRLSFSLRQNTTT